ncbi:hypothetical protein [Cryobacterium sp. 10I5]|uniref:hypothetical protein n=1 Tax=Cryobacterium sp. 10I5 TaxID=3048581 RepID=UPI002B2312FD|nr:hypothetical protein [Cryobacterium sp. 10I5]MEB0265075.1 hypothetical protein [Cryobacterium sp. 10I5]
MVADDSLVEAQSSAQISQRDGAALGHGQIRVGVQHFARSGSDHARRLVQALSGVDHGHGVTRPGQDDALLGGLSNDR